MYIDVDSSYRDRSKDPNPADFEVSHTPNFCSNQLVLFPRFQTPPLFFYLDTDQHPQCLDYLPLMYRTNDPHVIRLDGLPIRSTSPSTAGQMIADRLYPTGIIPLGQANEFYTNDYLENIVTREVREIVSFTYTTGQSVLQTMSVLWAVKVGSMFKVGVSPLSNASVSPTNIYNLYRGKLAKFITGGASGKSTLITDYRVQNADLCIFTLQEYVDYTPEYGDVFQIITTQEWFATIGTPFSTPLPNYPSYIDPIPPSDQFIMQIVYQSTNQIVLGTGVNDQLYIAFYDESTLSQLVSLDDDALFWSSPQYIADMSNYGGIAYDGLYLYYIGQDQSICIFNQSRIIDTSTTYIDLSGCPDTRYIGQIHTVYLKGETILAYVSYAPNYYLLTTYKVGVGEFPYVHVIRTTPIVIHSFTILADDRWVLVYATINDDQVTQYIHLQNTLASSEIDIGLPRLVDPSSFDLYAMRNIKSTMYNDILYTPTFAVIDGLMTFRLVQSTLVGGTWNHTEYPIIGDWDVYFYSITALGVVTYVKDGHVYLFNWVNTQLRNQTTPILSGYTIHSFDVRVLNDALFIVCSVSIGTAHQVITLTQQIVAENVHATPYRIRRNEASAIVSSVQVDNANSRIELSRVANVNSSGCRDVFFLSQWHYIQNTNLYKSTNLVDWSSVPFTLSVSEPIVRIRYMCNLEILPSDVDVLKSFQDENVRYNALYGDDAWMYVVTTNDTYLMYRDSLTLEWYPIGTMPIYNFPVAFMVSTQTTYTSNQSSPVTLVTCYADTIYELVRQPISVNRFALLTYPIPYTFTWMVYANPNWFAIDDHHVYQATELSAWWIVYTSPSEVFRQVTWSPELGCLAIISSTRVVYTFNLTAFETSIIQSNLTSITWNTYYNGFFVTTPDKIIYSTNMTEWVQGGDGYDNWISHKTEFGCVGLGQIDFVTLRIVNQTDRFSSPVPVTPSDYVWVYNRAITYDLNYIYTNKVLNVVSYDETTTQVVLSQPILIELPFRVWFEVLSDTFDSCTDLNRYISFVPNKCYTISLEHIIVPNKLLSTYIGNQVSFYPYIYVKVSNIGKPIYNFTTNNPAATTFTFKLPVSQFTKDPSALPFIRLSSGMQIKNMFDPTKPFRLTVYLPNGEVYQTLEKDTNAPDYPNPLLQVSALLYISE